MPKPPRTETTRQIVRQAMAANKAIAIRAGTGASATGRVVYRDSHGFLLETATEQFWFGWSNSTVVDGPPVTAFRVGERVRVRDGVEPAQYVGREGVVDHTNSTWVYVQGAQFMGAAPAGFRPEELEHV